MALLRHGLSDSEAKVYLTLLDHARMPAASLAKLSGVPRSHLYKVLEDLHGKELVDVLLQQGSRTYRARPFLDFIERRSQELRDQLTELEQQAGTIGAAMRPPAGAVEPLEAGEVRLIVGRRLVAREIDTLLEAARREIVIGVGAHSADRVARHLSPFWDVWDRAGNPPKLSIILPVSTTWPGEHSTATPVLRTIETRWSALSFVVDEDRLLVIHPIPEGGDLRTGRDVALFSDDPVFVRSHKELLLAASRCVALAGANGPNVDHQ